MTNYPAPSPAYIGPPAHLSSGSNKPIKRIVIHCTVSACVEGGARSIAAYFKSPSAGGSAHYTVDPGETIQCAFDSAIAWHAPPNQHSLGVELCDPMTDHTSDPKGKRWVDANHQRMLKRAARLVAALCLAYEVPPRLLTVAQVKAGQAGICGHTDVSQAFGQSVHWDPGPHFPWDDFMALVKKSYLRRKARFDQPKS